MIFRIDDVSVNTDLDELAKIRDIILEHEPGAELMLAFSPLVHDMRDAASHDRQRAFPRRLSAMSDVRNFFKVQRASAAMLPPSWWPNKLHVASHGLVHADHRLLSRDVQELSIMASCSLLGADTFVPPFNKWNRDTELICLEHEIKLVKFEHGWKHVHHNDPPRMADIRTGAYYLHTHDTTAEWLREWFRKERTT